MPKAPTAPERGLRLLEPGYGGDLSAEEMAYIVAALQRDGRLRRLWGFRAAQRRFGAGVLQRVALFGDPRSPSHNARLVRRLARSGSPVTAPEAPASPSTASPPRRTELTARIREMASQGMSYRKIAAALAAEGLRVSHMKVARVLQRRLIA